jgi:hypothetical protein
MRRSRFVMPLLLGSIAALLTAAGQASAQEATLKVGLTSSTFTVGDRPAGDPTRGRGWLAGASFFLTAADLGGWQLEALFIQKHARNVTRLGDSLELSYLEVPIVLHGDVWQQDDRGIFFIAGPSLAVNLQARYTEDGTSEDVKDDIARVDAGLHLGGGVELGPLVVDARYILGLRSVFHVDDVAFRNRTFAITAGVRWR